MTELRNNGKGNDGMTELRNNGKRKYALPFFHHLLFLTTRFTKRCTKFTLFALVPFVKNLVSFVVKIKVLPRSLFRHSRFRYSVIPSFRHSLLRHSQTGSLLVEFVFALPLLFILIMGVVQLAQIWTARMVTHYAAFCAARATLVANDSAAQAKALDAAKQVCAWMAFDHDGADGGNVPGWGNIPNSAGLNKRVRVRVIEGSTVGAPWLKGAEVQFDFNLLIPVAGTMLGYLSRHEVGNTSYELVSGWTGEYDHGNYRGPFITLKETVWLPKPYSTRRYPLE